MIVTQQEIDMFRAVLANRPEYNEAQEALDIIVAKRGNLVAAYPFLASEIGTRSDGDNPLEPWIKLAQACWEKCRDKLEQVIRSPLTRESFEIVFQIVLAYQVGIPLSVAVGVVLILLRQKF